MLNVRRRATADRSLLSGRAGPFCILPPSCDHFSPAIAQPRLRLKAAIRTASVVVAVAAWASGCSYIGSASTTLRSLATNPYGVGHVNAGEETLLVGTAPWCVTGEPVRLKDLAWEDDGGVAIAGFTVVNQSAAAGRIGSQPGELSSVGLGRSGRQVTTRCTSDTGEPEMVSYLVLALRTSDTGSATYGKGLVASWVDQTGRTGETVDEFTVVLCPRGSPSCDDEDVAAS